MRRVICLLTLMFVVASGCSNPAASALETSATLPSWRTYDELREYTEGNAYFKELANVKKDDYFFVSGLDGVEYYKTFQIQEELQNKQVGILLDEYDIANFDGVKHVTASFPCTIDVVLPDDVDRGHVYFTNGNTLYLCFQVSEVSKIKMTVSGSGDEGDEAVYLNELYEPLIKGTALYMNSFNSDALYKKDKEE